MRVPLRWLSSYVEPTGEYADPASGHGWNLERLIDRLVMTGTEIEAVHRIGPESTENLVVGRVLSAEPHPDADRLRVCSVDTGEEQPRTIVCGAPNVAAGQCVPVALPGALLPGGITIKRAKLRGVASEGMILSEAELELSAESDGIAVLAGPDQEADFAPGAGLTEALPEAAGDTVLELEVTPNRSDCFSLYGIAREVHAITGGRLRPAPWAEPLPDPGPEPVDAVATVTVEDPQLCPRFTAAAFTEVEVGPSPDWLKARLLAAGQRPINNVVDITNYVMLLTGQPSHAFDLDRVPGGELTIRRARAGEQVETLDGASRELDQQMVVVCDREGPAAIAGIMGGASSEVSAQTSRVLLEVANWDGPNILASSRRLALRSEASSRFEKQLHPALCDRAQNLAAQLMVELCGARLLEGILDVDAGQPQPNRVGLRTQRTGRLLGMEIEAERQAEYLERLGFQVECEAERLVATVPPDRHYDVTREADLIEEVGRVHGLEQLPATLPESGAGGGGLTRQQALRRRCEDVIRDLGFAEVVGWSFTDPEENRRLRLVPGQDSEPVQIANPLSGDQSVMRTTLLGSLMSAAAYNGSRGAGRIALFESGRVYMPRQAGETAGADPLAGDFPGRTASPALEPHRLGAVLCGPLTPRGWNGHPEAAGFFALKGVAEALAGQLGLELSFEPGDRPYLHPGRAAQVSLAGSGVTVGWLGEVHPQVAEEWDLPAATAFEFDLASLIGTATSGEEIFQDVTSFPAVLQDLAVVVPEQVLAEQVRSAVVGGAGELLRRAEVFDLYRGEQLGEGRKSLALRLEFRADDRTLTEQEVADLRHRIERSIEPIGGTVRG